MRKLIYVLIATVFIYSCKKDNNDNDLKKVIQPLEVGYSWTFVDSSFINDGEFVNVDTSTLSIVGKEFATFEGQEIELFYWKWDLSDAIWLMNDEGGSFYLYGARLNDVSYLVAKSLRQPYPVLVGDTWNDYHFTLLWDSDSVRISAIDTIEIECQSIDYPLQTSIGELECVVAFYATQYSDDLHETYMYHSPNIGYVGLEIKDNNVVTYKKTLLNYDFSNKEGLSSVVKSVSNGNDKNKILDPFGLEVKH